jgi:hypothetical protein
MEYGIIKNTTVKKKKNYTLFFYHSLFWENLENLSLIVELPVMRLTGMKFLLININCLVDLQPEEQVLLTASPPSSPVAPAPTASMKDVLFDLEKAPTPSQAQLPNIEPESPKPGPSTAPDTEPALNRGEEIELEEAVLNILGEAPQSDLALGKNIHKDIAARWQEILLKGLPRELKDTIMKKYLVPENCYFLVGPILNPEAKTAIPEVLVKRDTTLLQKQNQIGVALAALSQVTEMIIQNETSMQALLLPLSDACRILCDSHNIETKTRRSIIMTSTNTGIRDALTNTVRDKYLFGEDLAEKIKIAKSVQKTGESLLKANPVSSSNKNFNSRNNQKQRYLNSKDPIQKKPPFRNSGSARGRPPTRQPRNATFSRQPPPPAKAPSPTKRKYHR